MANKNNDKPREYMYASSRLQTITHYYYYYWFLLSFILFLFSKDTQKKIDQQVQLQRDQVDLEPHGTLNAADSTH